MSNTYENTVGVSSALTALGSAYRHDWSQVDGRTLRSQLDGLASYLVNNTREFKLEEWLENNHITKDKYGTYTWRD